MNADIRRLWIKGLRAGTHKQCRGQLRKDGRFCALGVLCDVVDPGGWRPAPRGDCWPHHQMRGAVSQRVLRACGLTSAQADVVSTLNDREKASFAEIADWIEANIPAGEVAP